MLYFQHKLHENTLLGVLVRRMPTDHSIYYLSIFTVCKSEKHTAISCTNEMFFFYIIISIIR
jgi:hypothetical protein